MAQLDHPDIGQIYRVLGNPCTLVMKRVEGQDLPVKLTRGAIPLDHPTRIARQIADPLEAAHECGFIHRALKPAQRQAARGRRTDSAASRHAGAASVACCGYVSKEIRKKAEFNR